MKSVLLGTIGTTITFILSNFDKVLAYVAGILTVVLLILKVRREWKHRNDPPADDF